MNNFETEPGGKEVLDSTSHVLSLEAIAHAANLQTPESEIRKIVDMPDNGSFSVFDQLASFKTPTKTDALLLLGVASHRLIQEHHHAGHRHLILGFLPEDIVSEFQEHMPVIELDGGVYVTLPNSNTRGLLSPKIYELVRYQARQHFLSHVYDLYESAPREAAKNLHPKVAYLWASRSLWASRLERRVEFASWLSAFRTASREKIVHDYLLDKRRYDFYMSAYRAYQTEA